MFGYSVNNLSVRMNFDVPRTVSRMTLGFRYAFERPIGTSLEDMDLFRPANGNKTIVSVCCELYRMRTVSQRFPCLINFIHFSGFDEQNLLYFLFPCSGRRVKYVNLSCGPTHGVRVRVKDCDIGRRCRYGSDCRCALAKEESTCEGPMELPMSSRTRPEGSVLCTGVGRRRARYGEVGASR